ncbi:MAG: hypothetical protein AAB652_00620 [Patescibacteria group bacterium]
MRKKNIIVVVVLVLVLGAFWLGNKFNTTNGNDAPSAYSAVYLSTGDVYFGKLHWFPRPWLENVWSVRAGVDPQNRSQLGFVPFKEAAWKPMDRIYLNPQQIIFWTKLKAKDNDVVKYFSDPGLLRNTQPPEGAPVTNTP